VIRIVHGADHLLSYPTWSLFYPESTFFTTEN